MGMGTIFFTASLSIHQETFRTWTLSLHFNGHFPGEPGLAGVY